MTEADLMWEAYWRARGDAERNALVEHYLPLVRAHAERIGRVSRAGLTLAEMMSAGALGLMGAVERFDPEGGASFEDYAGFRIGGSILDECRAAPGTGVRRSRRSRRVDGKRR